MKNSRIILITVLLATAALTGCSDSTAPLADPVAVPDTAPPAVPSGLSAAAGNNGVKLSWRANTTDADVQGYRVYRLAFGEVWPLTAEAVASTRFIDTAPLQGAATYAVTAVDNAGNESAWAQVVVNEEPEAVVLTKP